MFPVETDDNDGDDDDGSVSKLPVEPLAELAHCSTFDVTNDFDAPTDEEKSCFDFYA